ncbi:hypothetical protein V5799_014727, partial [Amblyomma americanum]
DASETSWLEETGRHLLNCWWRSSSSIGSVLTQPAPASSSPLHPPASAVPGRPLRWRK